MIGMGIFGDKDGQSGFTPVRTPHSTTNSRKLNEEPEKEWTATRCNRLLRALTSRVALLKKDLSRMRNGAPILDANAKVMGKRKRAQDEDEDWSNGNHTKKRVKRKYSGRQAKAAIGGRVQSQTCAQEKSNYQFVAGDISVPTPFLNRTRGNIIRTNAVAAVPFLQDHTQDDNTDHELKAKRRYRKEELAQYQQEYNTYMYELKKKNYSPSVTSIYEGIYNGLESLLKATSDTSNLKSKGTGSLFAMCLRAVPRYISVEQIMLENEPSETGKGRNIDSRDVSSEIYDDLESLGSSSRGWKHLKTVVRSHGVQVVREAIATGLLEMGFCSVLINLCFQSQATGEGETLLSALLSMGAFPPPQSIFTHAYHNNATLPLFLLWNATEIGVSETFKYQQLSYMISDDRLPLSWLATKDFSPVWTKAIQGLSSQTTNIEILHFLVAALERLAKIPDESSERRHYLDDALNQTFSGILTTISAIVILSRQAENNEQETTFRPEIIKYEHIIRLLRSCLIEWENSDARNTLGSLLFLANISVGSLPDDTHSQLGLVRHLLVESRKYRGLATNNLVDFICSIASCCGRGTSTKGFEHLKQLHWTLESLALTREHKGGNILHELIVDSSFMFAQQASDSEYLDYATSTEAKFHVVKTKQVIGETPTKLGGFRWEEGISEWVIATPAVNKSWLCIGMRNASSECASPFSNNTIRQRVNRSNSSSTIPSAVSSPRLKSRVRRYSHGSPISPISPSSSDVNDEDPVSLTGQQSPNSSFATTISTSSESSASPSTSCRRGSRISNIKHKGTNIEASRKLEIFEDESDDELSFWDTSSHEEPTLQDITNAVRINKQQPTMDGFGNGRNDGQKKAIRKKRTKVLEDSEDELGM